ncbi:MAG TPA: complex I NDUFA9 subunit family protein, partial [Alphaproteobacteria bacterium]|nr:complex I NDUFA9 subunit family protein [Alphaproteobacteria bacterium]
MSMHTVTVFGGTGFLGRYIIRRLARTGARIRVATRNPGQANFLRPNGNVGQIVPLPCAVRSDESVAAVIRGADTVVNLVGILSESGRSTFEAMHHELPARIARIAAASGVERMVHVSAIGADAQSPSAYAKSKAAGEQAVQAAFPAATILRPSVVFGPEDDFFNRFAKMARISPFLPLIGGGHTRFQPVYVGDVATAVGEALIQASAAGHLYELGGPKIYSFAELMQLVLAQMGRKRPLVDMPWGLARALASVLEKLPGQALTRDQLLLLQSDNVVSG